MHACGHDGHMAAMLGTVQYLCEHRDQLTQNVTIVFQPGEESPGGAKPMIEHGLFDKYKIDCMIGMHVVGDLPEDHRLHACQSYNQSYIYQIDHARSSA